MVARIASINAGSLYKGQAISANQVWDYFVTRKPEKLDNWLVEYGDEETAKAARLPQVMIQVRDWLERDRRQAGLAPLVMNTVGGSLNVLTDDKASTYLNDQAFQGLRRHQRATSRLVDAVDESRLSGAGRREHQNRINVHSFIAASTQGAQKQLRLLKRAGKDAPQIDKR
tara:strand:+ start:730 stop:1242 length:513 start_codon:yes stop_codon:yes gene_type:complete